MNEQLIKHFVKQRFPFCHEIKGIAMVTANAWLCLHIQLEKTKFVFNKWLFSAGLLAAVGLCYLLQLIIE